LKTSGFCAATTSFQSAKQPTYRQYSNYTLSIFILPSPKFSARILLLVSSE